MAPRPAGPLVWLHAAEAGSAPRILDLAARMMAQDHGLHVLLTAPPNMGIPAAPEGVIVEGLPADGPAQAAAFFAHWRPQVGLWAWGDLRPNMILAAQGARVPLVLIDAGAEGLVRTGQRWLPDVSAHITGVFGHALARSDAAEARLVRMGVRTERCGPLIPGGRVPKAAQSDLDEMTTALAARQVWYADGISAAEVPYLLAAQRRAQRLSHRLLLIAAPADAAAETRLAESCAAERMRLQLWSDGALPEETTAVLMADLPDEEGLWLRLAPLVFLGGSMGPGAKGRDPMQAAALGAAILYGPGVGHHLEAYKRLASAGAARIVNDGPSLAAAVSQLIAPDQAARMALAGWDVVTQGAAATDRVIELAFAALEAADIGAD
ncbi:MAG: glycosyltransferase N-terminal domain-containing protein [Pseudomonadota bacterium]